MVEVVSETIQVGRYLCHQKIGTGGMAEIYQARLVGARGFAKEVAIKLMHRHLSANSSIVDLFVNEARITADLDHPNIVTVFELGKHEGQLFMVMELVDGLDLGALLARLAQEGRTMEWDVALAIAVEVARALQFVHACVPGRRGHAAPVVHRDLSPGNIMVSRAGGVKLLDFGVAKTLLGDDDTDTIARGKWHYMSPEQVRGEKLDGRSDLFSLGAVLFELLTGRQAFKGQTVVDTMRNVEQADLPPAPDLEPVLEELLTTLLARDRDERYPDASAGLGAMAQILMLRGKTTGDRQIATLVNDLDTSRRPAVEAAEAGPVLAAVDSAYLGVGDQTDLHTIPQRNPDARKNVAADQTVPGETSTAPVSPLARVRAEGPGKASAGTGDEPTDVTDDELTDVTDDQLTNPKGARPTAPAPPDVAAPAAAQDAAPEASVPQASAPQVYLDHVTPDEEVQEVRVSPRLWTGRNLVVLILAVLAIVIAGVAIVIAVSQRRERQRNGRAKSRRTHPGQPLRRAADATAPAPLADAATRPRSKDAAPPPHRTPPAGDRRRVPPTPSGTVPTKGPVKAGQLDVLTNPPGVRVYVNGTLRGVSPLRALAPAGSRIRVALSLGGRGLYRARMWMPRAVGRRLKILMPFLTKPFKEARPGRTAIKVLCKTAGVHRVYIDGRDTGRDCPTPPLEVAPVVHYVDLYLPTTGKTVRKKLRPKPRQVTTVSWDH